MKKEWPLFSGFLWKKLIIPLSIGTTILFVLAVCIPWRGLFVNLTTTFLGILITICYVDFVLKQHNKERWAQTMVQIESRIQRFAIVSVTQFRVAFKIGPGVINKAVMDINDPSSIRKEIIRVIERELLPFVENGVHNMDKKDWLSLVRQLQLMREWADRLVAAHGNHIDPLLYSLIMKIGDETDGLLTFYATYPDVIGVPDSELHMSSSKAEKLGMEKVISFHVKDILESSASLMGWMNKSTDSGGHLNKSGSR